MARKHQSPAVGTARDLEKVSAVGTADPFQIAPQPFEIQKNRLRDRFDIGDALAGVVAELAYSTTDDRRGAR
jgi:hypothetical protein